MVKCAFINLTTVSMLIYDYFVERQCLFGELIDIERGDLPPIETNVDNLVPMYGENEEAKSLDRIWYKI